MEKKTGKKKGLLVFYTPDEMEYLRLWAKIEGYSMASLIRMSLFKANWKNELAKWKVKNELNDRQY